VGSGVNWVLGPAWPVLRSSPLARPSLKDLEGARDLERYSVVSRIFRTFDFG
jgi:hypothetical protein